MGETGVVVDILVFSLRNSHHGHHPILLGHGSKVDVWFSVLIFHLLALDLGAMATFTQVV